MRDPPLASSAWISHVAQKKSGALSRPTLFALPQDQVLAMAAPAATVTASATVKASTTMGAFAAMKAFATIVPSTPVAHAAVRAAVAGMVRPVIGAVIEVVVVVSFMTLPITKVPPIAKVPPVTVLSTFKVTIVSI